MLAKTGRIEVVGKVVHEIMNIPDDILQRVIDKADCVVVLPSVVKFAIGIGGGYGQGVMTCRCGKNFQGPWSAPTMMALGSTFLRLPEHTSGGLRVSGQSLSTAFLNRTV